MTNFQWTLFTLCGVIIVVNANIWLAKRDAKMLSTPPQSEEVIYLQLPVIPFTNWYYEHLKYSP